MEVALVLGGAALAYMHYASLLDLGKLSGDLKSQRKRMSNGSADELSNPNDYMLRDYNARILLDLHSAGNSSVDVVSLASEQNRLSRAWLRRMVPSNLGLFKAVNSIDSEETKIFRGASNTDPNAVPMPGGLSDALEEKMIAKNDKIARLEHANMAPIYAVPDTKNRVQIAAVPSRSHPFASSPLVFLDAQTVDHSYNWIEPFGEALPTPENGPNYPFTDIQYHGNPWGLGGSYANHYRTAGGTNTGFYDEADREIIPIQG